MSEIVTCIECANWSLRDVAEGMARQRWGACGKDDQWVCYAADKLRQCEHHAPAEPGVVVSRREWLARVSV